MLLQKISNTRKLVNDVLMKEDQSERRNAAASFLQVVEQLQKSWDEFQVRFRLLHEKNQADFPVPNLEDVKKALGKLIEQVQEGKIPRQGVPDLKELDKGLQQLWVLYVERQISEPLRVLRLCLALYQQTSEIQAMIKQLEQVATKWPINQADIRLFDTKLKEVTEQVARLDAKPEVQTFLEKVSRRQATIADLNETVLQWLREQKVDNNLFIRLT